MQNVQIAVSGAAAAAGRRNLEYAASISRADLNAKQQSLGSATPQGVEIVRVAAGAEW